MIDFKTRMGTLKDSDIIMFLDRLMMAGSPADPKQALDWAMNKIYTHPDHPVPKNFSRNA